MDCDECGFEAKTAAGLASHRRKHAEPDAGGPMAVAMEQTIVELKRLGRFEDIDAARIQSLRSMAASLDGHGHNSQMWREMREALNEVTKADDQADDSLAAALAAISGATSMGNPKAS